VSEPRHGPPAEAGRRRGRGLRSLAIAGILGAMVVLFYIITLIRLSP